MKRQIPRLVSDEILGLPLEDRLAYFNRKIVAHPHLVNASELAKDNIEIAPAGSLVAVVGPTEVGTRVLGQSLRKYYRTHGDFGQLCEPDPQRTRCVLIDAVSSADRITEKYWTRTLRQILISLGDILIDNKIFVPSHQFELLPSLPNRLTREQDIDTLLAATTSMLHARGTRVLLINQAERLFPENDKAGCIRSQQILQDLANHSGCRFVLLSNYSILRSPMIIGDFVQRSQVVHLRRYDYTDAEEYAHFNSSMDELIGNMPCIDGLRSISEKGATKLYVSAVGSIGSLKGSLSMCLGRALRTGEKITEDLLLQFLQPGRSSSKRAEDALFGERMLTDVDMSDVERILNGEWQGGSTQNTAQGRQVPTASSKSSSPSKRPRIGERKPTRDPAGGVYARQA